MMMRPITAAWFVAATVLSVAALNGQTPSPELAFEVVSLKRNLSLTEGGGGGPRRGGRYILTNVPVRSLISIAYDIPNDRILGGPSWAATDRYDVDAIGKDNPDRNEARQMLRSMLRERFNLAARVEQRDLDIYALVPARANGQLGPGLRRALPCEEKEARAKATARPCMFTVTTGKLTGGGIELSVLTSLLSSPTGRPVFDRTGLAGVFDIDLQWTALTADDRTDGTVSIFTAVQEQLGLKLEGATAPLDVLIVERLDLPSEN